MEMSTTEKYHLATLLHRKHQLYSLIQEFRKSPTPDEIDVQEVIAALKPVLICLKSKHFYKFHSQFQKKVLKVPEEDLLSKYETNFVANRGKFDQVSVLQKHLGVAAYLSLKWYKIDKSLKQEGSNFCDVFQVRDLVLLEEQILRVIHNYLSPDVIEKMNTRLNTKKDGAARRGGTHQPHDFDQIGDIDMQPDSEGEDEKSQLPCTLSIYGVYQHLRWLTLDQLI